MSKGISPTSRRSILGGLAASILAPLMWLLGGSRVKAEMTKDLGVLVKPTFEPVDYEHMVAMDYADGSGGSTTPYDSVVYGEREMLRRFEHEATSELPIVGGSVELRRRPVGAWEVVRRAEANPTGEKARPIEEKYAAVQENPDGFEYQVELLEQVGVYPPQTLGWCEYRNSLTASYERWRSAGARVVLRRRSIGEPETIGQGAPSIALPESLA